MPPLNPSDAGALIKRRHPEWVEFQRTWRWLADSLEGGERYRQADYTLDAYQAQYQCWSGLLAAGQAMALGAYGATPWYLRQAGDTTALNYGQVVDRNLIPHRRELSEDGKDLYLMRLARTAVPNTLARTVENHVAKVYSRDVRRSGPKDLEAWWADVDGRGTPVGRWVEETAGPLLLALGQIDLVAEHPKAPDGAVVRTLADLRRLGLTSCRIGVILPENLVWWRLDSSDRYAEVLVLERTPLDLRWRHWTAEESNAYDLQGKHLKDASYTHKFGAPPVVRVFDRRNPRTSNCGRSRYWVVADLQRSIYNTRSELVLSDVQQSHAQLQAPEEYLTPDAEVPIGPGNVLPMKPIYGASGTVAGYQGHAYLDPPKGAQQEIRQHLLDWQDEADREGALAKPAGLSASSGTVGQSGISKQVDQQDGNAVLGRVAAALEGLEKAAACLALRVLGDGPPKPADEQAVTVAYPRQFDLFTADDVAKVLQAVQTAVQQAGALPETETALITRMVSLALPGLPPDELVELVDEIEAFIASAGAHWRAQPAAGDTAAADPATGVEPQIAAADPAEYDRPAPIESNPAVA
jgi:hypothetical protein